MKCPFLKDASVKYCEASAYRKMLVKDAVSSEVERCSTEAWSECRAAAQRRTSETTSERCPFLHEAQAEYCGAASVTKFIPATNDFLSRCNSDGHLYCELYLAHVDPQGARLLHHRSGDPLGATPSIDGVPVPLHLHYARNHMWLDVSDDGSCHIGIDAFAARVFGDVQRVTFVPQKTRNHPTAVLRVNGIDVPMVFPEAHAVSANVYLRTSLSKLTEDPYGAGWLFECVEPPAALAARRSDLVTGPEAVEWMHEEMRRLDEFAHERLAKPDADGLQLMADGGAAAEGIAACLDRDDLITLALEFFTAPTDSRRSS
jgi:glycine cleavage system H lipoate-binding protein